MPATLDASDRSARARRTCTVPIIIATTAAIVLILWMLRSQPQFASFDGFIPSTAAVTAERPRPRPGAPKAPPTATPSTSMLPSVSALPTPSVPGPPSASPPPPGTAAAVAAALVPLCPPTRMWTVVGVTPWFNGDHPWAKGPLTCPNGCRISWTHNMGMLGDADLLLYHARDADHGHRGMPRSSVARQRRALLASETMDLASYDADWYNRFNSEISFRPMSFVRDTYVYWMFGTGEPQAHDGSYTGKFSTARCFNDIWQAPLPTAQRYTDVAYIRQLMTAAPLRIVGSNCLSNHSDPFNGMDRPSQWQEFRKYKFHLAFENHRCEGYVTEKFYQSLWLGQVPIVLGAPNIADHAPPHSYIDASQYTPEELGQYLNHLNNDDAAYEAYHAWRQLGFDSYGIHMRREFLSVLRLADDPSVGTRDYMWQNCIVCNALECDAAQNVSTPLTDGIPPFSQSCLPAWPEQARAVDDANVVRAD